MDKTPTFNIGERLDRYEIIDVLPAGGMGEVYRAWDPKLQRDVAIKLLVRTESHDLERFTREAQTLAGFSHQNLVSIFDFGATARGGREIPYLIMQFIDGHSLRERPGASTQQVLRWMSDVAEGLAALHRGRVLHRDLKPANIMIGGDDIARIVDFGLAKADGTTVTTTNTIVGTPDYFSPEQAKNRPLDPRSDIFSFGVVLQEALTGKHPFRRPNAPDTVHRICFEPPDDRIPDRLGEIVAKCLAKDPAHRYVDAADVARDLREVHEPLLQKPALRTTRASTRDDAATVKLNRGLTPNRRLRWMALIAVLIAGVAFHYREQFLPTGGRATPTAAPAAIASPAPVGLPSCGISASPASIKYGDAAEVRWSSTNASDVVISPSIGVVSPNGTIDVLPRFTTTYEIVATNTDGIATRGSVTINVTDAPADRKYVPLSGSFHAHPEQIRPGEETLLQWNSFGATSVVITPSVGIVPLNGAVRVAPRTATTYTLRLANDHGGSGTASATVTVDPNAKPQPAANPTAGLTCVAETQGGIGRFDSSSTSCTVPPDRRVRQATLEYMLDDAGEITIDGRTVFTKRSGDGTRQGSVTLPVAFFEPGKSFLVTVAAHSAAADGAPSRRIFGRAAVHLVTTPPPVVVEMSVSPGAIKKGEAAQLSWSSSGATAAAINPIGIVAPTGTMNVTPSATTTYRITAFSASGEMVSGNATLTVQ